MAIGRQLNIKVLDLCNATCSFCGYNKERLKERVRNGHVPYKLNVEALKKSYSDLRKKGIRILHLTGGEPTLHPEFRELVRSAKAAGFQVRTGTNGSMLDTEMVDTLGESEVDFLWYSLDTFPFQKHLDHRGFRSIRNKMEHGLRLLRRSRINFFGQTVISRVLPVHEGLPDLRGHMEYYSAEYGIDRFVFSYPMHRSDSDDMAHLATLGSESVSFSTDELRAIFLDLLRIKSSIKPLTIVNPYVSIWQQIRELDGKSGGMGCYAGRDIFFLGADQKSLSPCYHLSGRVVDSLDSAPLRQAEDLRDCKACKDQCFRDPSVVYSAMDRPGNLAKQVMLAPMLLKMLVLDVANVAANRGYRRHSVRQKAVS